MHSLKAENQRTHTVLGVVLGVLGCIIAITLCMSTGILAGIIALLLGALAMFIGFRARRSGRGIGAIVAGIAAVLLAVSLTFTSFQTMTNVRRLAEQTQQAPLVLRCMDKPWLGLMGIASSITEDMDTDELTRQMTELLEQLNNAAVSQTAMP